MKRLFFIFSIIFIFIFSFSFSSSAESITKVIQLNSDSVTKEDFSKHSSSTIVAITIDDDVTLTVNTTSTNPQAFVAFDLSKFDLDSISDIVINDLFIDYINEGTNYQYNFGFVLNDHLYYKYATKWGSAFPKTENSFSILGTYYDHTDLTEFSAAEPFELTSSDIPKIQCLVFHSSGCTITLNSLTLVGDPVTSPSFPAQPGNIISPDDMGLNIWNGLTNNSGNLIIILSVALSIVGVFIAIKIALNLFHEGVK